MRISPRTKNYLIYGYIIYSIIVAISMGMLPYTAQPISIFNCVIISLILETIVTFLFLAAYFDCVNSFKDFESKINNVDFIEKAIEYSRVINVITPPSHLVDCRVDTIIFNNGIEINLSIYDCEPSISDYELSIADVEIPKHSYLHYLITKKNNEYYVEIKKEEANKRTESIINKMRESQYD